MTKAFDLADLLARLKAKGLAMVEEDVRIAVHEVFGWTADSCVLSGNPVVAAAALGIPKLEEFVDGYVNKIDGMDANGQPLKSAMGAQKLDVTIHMDNPMKDNGAAGPDVKVAAHKPAENAKIPAGMVQPADHDMHGEPTPGAK